MSAASTCLSIRGLAPDTAIAYSSRAMPAGSPKSGKSSLHAILTGRRRRAVFFRTRREIRCRACCRSRTLLFSSSEVRVLEELAGVRFPAIATSVPGRMALQRTPNGPTSRATLSVSASSATLLTVYGDRWSGRVTTEDVEMLSTTPERAQRTLPKRSGGSRESSCSHQGL